MEHSDLFLHLREFICFEDGLGRDEGTWIHSTIAVQTFIAQRIKEGEHLVVVLLGDGIEFVIVALGTAECEAKHRFAKRLDSIRIVVGEVLVWDGAAFVRYHVIALETRRDQVRFGVIGHEIASKLFRQEVVIRLVVIEGLDHPIAPEPHLPAAINGEAVGVRITRRI